MNEEKITKLWDDYQNGLKYQSAIGLSTNLPKFVKFYEGDQWPAPTKNTRNLPRPVVNIIKMICRNKKSAILSTPVKILYRSWDEKADVEKFNHFAEYIQKELGQEELDKEAIDQAVKKGAYFYHYYWDSEACGQTGVHEGALRGEMIDPLNIFFSNPKERDEQKQKWILIKSREDVSSVRAKCDKGVDIESICADDSDDKYGTVEQDGDKLCTVLTRYFRKDGEVWCEKATKNAIINQPFPIAPDVDAAMRELEENEDAPNNSLPDDPRKQAMPQRRARAPLYPIVVGNYEIREKSIYGLGEVEGLIPNQKSINFNLAMSLLNAQEVAWGKYVVHPNALREQTINNEPGQVLVDYSQTGNGIRKMTEQSMQSLPIQLVETLTQMTRAVTGSSEVMTGEAMGANMSGAAIAQIQSQAQLPTEDLKEAFWLAKKKQGKVLAQFFRLYYYDKEFSYQERIPQTNTDGNPLMQKNGLRQEENTWISDVFNGSDYTDIDFDIVVETTSGTKASAAGDITILDLLFSKGAISLKTYLNAYPKDALSNKSEILKGIEADEQDLLIQLRAQNEQLVVQLAQYGEVIEKQNDTVKDITSLIRENNELKALLTKVYTEAKEKILAGNSELEEATQDAAEFARDATDFAHEIVRRDSQV